MPLEQKQHNERCSISLCVYVYYSRVCVCVCAFETGCSRAAVFLILVLAVENVWYIIGQKTFSAARTQSAHGNVLRSYTQRAVGRQPTTGLELI
jgi:predicted membrane channel-forming protein YqfA (hemolysin III family)